MKTPILSLFCFLSLTAFSQSMDCSMVHEGKFKEKNDLDKTAYIEIQDNWFIEYSNNKTEFIKSKIEWEDDCTYSLVLTETNIQDFEIPIGIKLKVQILSIEGNEITYQYLPEGALKPRVMVKLED